ncbi:MAG: FAD/NAD(P)-binding protein [Actinomycetota bacterium]|nr:FAD/NAD(P)-binding protein [Actinomycetota bacterium]
MTGVRIAIVGGGPMCTYAVERLAALLPEARRPGPVRIEVFERSGDFGAGEAHSDRQPRTNYMNRVVGQIALAADESNVAARPLLPRELRPTFLEWCRARDIDLDPRDVPKRHLHGLALHEAFDRYVGVLRATPGIEVELHAAEVTDVVPGGEAAFRVEAGGRPVPADHVLFVTGHTENRVVPGSPQAVLANHADRRPDARYVAYPYPLPERLSEEAVPPGASVGVEGLGLTAIDTLLYLTEGRGGRFEPAGDRLRYVPSGREPGAIVGFGPSGSFTHTRPRNEKVADPALDHRGAFFTIDAVRALRHTFGRPATLPSGNAIRQLDFDEHLFPLVVLEMAYVYQRTLRGEEHGERLRARAAPRHEAFLRGELPTGAAGIEALLEPLEEPFDWRAIHEPLRPGAAASGEEWHAAVVALVERDIADAVEGNLANPVKAACDGVWRDLRLVFSEAVDFGGLTPESQRRFATRHMRYYNRLSNGAGIEPMTKVLALLEAGMVDVSAGPAPVVEPSTGAGAFRIAGPHTGFAREVDVLVAARLHPFDPELEASPLYRNLVRRGLARRWRNQPLGSEDVFVPGGLDVSEGFHPLRGDGSVDARLTFLGAPAEGARSFLASAARPGSNSYVLNNVAAWAAELVEAVAAEPVSAAPA